MTPETQRELIQAYYASITFIDDQVGRLIQALEDRNMMENTIIVLLSDHGFQLGDHGLWQKGDLFEGSAHAPLIISAPGFRHAPNSVDSPVEFVDLYPTIVELAGLPIPNNLSGVSLRATLSDREATPRTEAYTMAVSRAGKTRDEFKFRSIWGHSIRTNRYRYTEWEGGAFGVELYDYESEDGELTNIAEREGEPANARAKLSKILRRRITEGRVPFQPDHVVAIQRQEKAKQ